MKIYLSKLTKACFHGWHGLWRFKNLPRRTASDKVLHDKKFNIAKNSKYDGYQRGLASLVFSSLIKSCQAMVLKVKIC